MKTAEEAWEKARESILLGSIEPVKEQMTFKLAFEQGKDSGYKEGWDAAIEKAKEVLLKMPTMNTVQNCTIIQACIQLDKLKGKGKSDANG